MKITKMCYKDNSGYIPGILIQRIFHKPIFVSMEPSCNWNYKIITRENKDKLTSYSSEQLPEQSEFNNYNKRKELKRLGCAALRFVKALDEQSSNNTG